MSTRALVKGFVKLFPGSTHMLLRPLIQLCFKPKIQNPKMSKNLTSKCPMKSMAFPWLFFGFFMDFPGFSMCFPWVFHVFSIVPWNFPVVFQRFSVPLRLRRGARPELATASCGFSAGEPVGEGLATSGEWFWAYPVGF